MSKLDDIVSFLKAIEYTYGFQSFTNIDVAHEVDYRLLSLIPLTTDSTARMLVKNMEVINTDYLRGTHTIMVDLEMEAEDEDDAETLLSNLIARVYDFNHRFTLYNFTVDIDDDFDSNAIGSVPAGWTSAFSGTTTLGIQAYLTHAKCVEMDLNSDATGEMTLTKALTTGKDNYIISFDMAHLNTSDVNFVGANNDTSYGASEGKLGGGTTAWASYSIFYDVIADTYEIYTNGVSDGFIRPLNGMSIEYIMAYNLSGAAVDTGITYLDNVKVLWGVVMSRPTKIIQMDLLDYGNLTFSPQIPNWKGLFRLAITYNI